MNNAMIADIEQISPRLLNPMEWTWAEIDIPIEDASPCFKLLGREDDMGDGVFTSSEVYDRVRLPFPDMAIYQTAGAGNNKKIILLEHKTDKIIVNIYEKLAPNVANNLEKVTGFKWFGWKFVCTLVFNESGLDSESIRWPLLANMGLLMNEIMVDAKRRFSPDYVPSENNEYGETIGEMNARWENVSIPAERDAPYFYRDVPEKLRKTTWYYMESFHRTALNSMAKLTLANETASLKIYLPAKAVGKDKINKARKKKNLQPMLRWTERVFEPQVVRVGGESRKGGTHASPYYHKRRGHWRHLLCEDMTKIPEGWEIAETRPGHIRRWIESMEINVRFKHSGKAVFHDYKIKEAA